MNRYSQVDPKWKHVKLGTGNMNFGQVGCFLMCLSMLSYTDPVKANAMLIAGDGYANGDRMISDRAADILGLHYEGRKYNKPNFICVAETRHYAPKVPQHFFIFAPRGTVIGDKDMMLDPLRPPKKQAWEPVRYKIRSYRLFHEKSLTAPLTAEEKKAWESMMKHKIYSKHTKIDTPVDTRRLAVILNRTLDAIIKLMKS